MPRCDPHRKITLKQTLDDALTEKASPAENGHLSSRHCSVHRDAFAKFRPLGPTAFRSPSPSHRPDHHAHRAMWLKSTLLPISAAIDAGA